jgi:predicted nucleotide-binding protein
MTPDELRNGIARLSSRLEAIDKFDLASISSQTDNPKFDALYASIDSALSKTFAGYPADYDRYQDAARKDTGRLIINQRPPLADIQRAVSKSLERSHTLLEEAIRYLNEQLEEIDDVPTPAATEPKERSKKVFIVHGHDVGARESVRRVLHLLGLDPIILQDQASQGLTLIEKFETHSKGVGFAVALLTPDDLGNAQGANAPTPRARQNVLFELGYFAGRLGRGHVCLLKSGDVEIPSDLYGVVYVEYGSHDGWKFNLAKELKAAGYEIDTNALL